MVVRRENGCNANKYFAGRFTNIGMQTLLGRRDDALLVIYARQLAEQLRCVKVACMQHCGLLTSTGIASSELTNLLYWGLD